MRNVEVVTSDFPVSQVKGLSVSHRLTFKHLQASHLRDTVKLAGSDELQTRNMPACTGTAPRLLVPE